jgi:hypothetical protein
MTGIARMSAKGPRRATTYLGWKNHGRIIARFLLLWGIYHLTLWQAMCVREYIQQVSSTADPEARIPLALFFEAFIRNNAWMVLYAAAFSTLLLWHLVSLTHRIVGPLKRTEEALYTMIAGKSVRQIEFRETDLIQDFEKAFNAYLAFLYGSSVEADITGAHSKQAEAKSVTPVMTPGDGFESPVTDDRIAALLN